MLGKFIPATNDTLKTFLSSFSLSSPDSLSRLSYVERVSRGYVEGTWLDGDTDELAVLRFYGIIRDASVGPYGVNAGLTRALWNKQKVRKLKQRIIVHFPRELDIDVRRACAGFIDNLGKVEAAKMGWNSYDQDVVMTDPSHHSFVKLREAGVDKNGHPKHSPELHVVWSPWEDLPTTPAAAPKSSALLLLDEDSGDEDGDNAQGSNETLESTGAASRTLAARPDLDPKDLYSYMLHASDKRSFVQRADVGAIDKDGKPVPPDQLSDVFRPGVIVQADVSLRHFCIRSGEGKSNAFQLYMCGIQALGNAYEDMPQERSASPALLSPKSGKRKAADALFGNAPVKRRLFSEPPPRASRELNKPAEHQNTAKVQDSKNASPAKGVGARSTRYKK